MTNEIQNPKYQVHDWVKLHTMSFTGSAMTYHVTAIRIDICEGGSQVLYVLRGHDREKGIMGATVLVAEMEIDAQIGTTIKGA